MVPPKLDKQQDTKTVCIRFPADELEVVAAQAKENERSVSQEIRWLVRGALEGRVA